MIGTSVQVQLYMFSYIQVGSIPTSNIAKNRRFGVKTVKIAQSKQFASANTKVFLDSTGQKLFRTVDKS